MNSISLQAKRESNAFVIPKNIPQKRPHGSVVKDIRLNRSASKGPTSSTGHNISKDVNSEAKTSNHQSIFCYQHHVDEDIQEESAPYPPVATPRCFRSCCMNFMQQWLVLSLKVPGCVFCWGRYDRNSNRICSRSICQRYTYWLLNSTNSFSFDCTFPGTGRNRVTDPGIEKEGLTSCCVISCEAISKSNAKACTVG